MSNIRGSLHQSLEGFYKVSVVDAESKNIIWEDPNWKKNLIINNGMDMIAAYSYGNCMAYAIGGTGTRLNSILSDISTVTQTGNLITLDPVGSLLSFTQSVGGYSNAAQVGDVIVYAVSGSTKITAVGNLSCSVDTTLTFTDSQSFTIWKTSQTGLQNEIARAGGDGINYLIPSSSYWLNGYCGYNIVGNQYQLYRTYDFGLEVAPKVYTEIGVGRIYTSTVGTTFSRILLDTPISVGVGQRLRVAYQLNINLMPSASIYRTGVTVPVITGWPVAPSTTCNATESLQNITSAIEGILSNGKPASNGFGYSLEPISVVSAYIQAWISTSSRSLAAFGSAVERGSGASPSVTYTTTAMTRGSYTNGTYYCDKTCTFALTQMNVSNIASFGFGFGSSAADASYQVYALLFQQTQSKSNTQTLTLGWRYSWDRTLSNGT